MREPSHPSSSRDLSIARRFKTALEPSLGGALDSVVLFGSRAQGKAAPDSDMDVLVVVRDSGYSKSTEKRIIDEASQISLQYEVALIPLVMTLSHYRKHAHLQTGLLQSIQRTGIPL